MKKLPNLQRRILAVVFCVCLMAISVVQAFAETNMDLAMDLIIPLDYVAVSGHVDTYDILMPLGLRTMSSAYGGSDQIFEATPNHPNGTPAWWLNHRTNYNETNLAYYADFSVYFGDFDLRDGFRVRFKSYDFVCRTWDLLNRDQFYHISAYDSLDREPWWKFSGIAVIPVLGDYGYELVEYEFSSAFQAKVPDFCQSLYDALDSEVLDYEYIYFKELEICVMDADGLTDLGEFFNNGRQIEGNITGHAAGVWKNDQGATIISPITVELWFDQFQIKSGSVTIVQPDGSDLFGWLIDPIEAFFALEIVPNLSIGGIFGILLTSLVLIAVLVMLKGR